jgi:tetratricopeptide (TPR) repeat protein
LTFEEILVREKVEQGILSQAKDGWRRARKGLIELQTAEGEHLLAGGDIRGAVDCWQAIIELAGDDLDAGKAGEMLARHGGETKLQAKILEGLDTVAPVANLPSEEEEDEEYFGDDPDEIFEVYLQTLPEKQAEAYRALGASFREAYLLVQEGKAKEALERFASVDDATRQSPYFHLESAQAHLLANQDEHALIELDGIDPPEEIRRRVAEMRAILLDRLGRGEEAEEEAQRVWAEGQDGDAAILYGEILLDRGKFDRVLEILKPFVHPSRPQPDVDRLVARAHAGVGQFEEMRGLLERAVESFFQGPGSMRDAPSFPIWAARDLLDFYVAAKEPPERVRSLAQHLIRHDPPSSERYKDILTAYARSLDEEGVASGGEGATTGEPEPQAGEQDTRRPDESR